MKWAEAITALREGKWIRVVGNREVSYRFNRTEKKVILRRRIANIVSENEVMFIPSCDAFEWEVCE